MSAPSNEKAPDAAEKAASGVSVEDQKEARPRDFCLGTVLRLPDAIHTAQAVHTILTSVGAERGERSSSTR